MRGRWAQGLEPRGFTWVIKDRLAASEPSDASSRARIETARHALGVASRSEKAISAEPPEGNIVWV